VRSRRFTMLRFTILCYVLICIPWGFDAENYRQGPMLLLMSMKLFPTLVLFVLCCAASAGVTERRSTAEQVG
jgi:hypothetical protein